MERDARERAVERTRVEELGRPKRSHIREDGRAKLAYATRESAIGMANALWQKTGRPHNVYMCWQMPEHYHIGAGIDDLV